MVDHTYHARPGVNEADVRKNGFHSTKFLYQVPYFIFKSRAQGSAFDPNENSQNGTKRLW